MVHDKGKKASKPVADIGSSGVPGELTDALDGLAGAFGDRHSQETEPLAFRLYQSRPNPFNPTTTIRYTLDEASDARLTIYDALGQQVRTLVSAAQGAGVYNVRWDGRDDFGRTVSTGLYLYRLQAGANDVVRKMILAK